MGDSVGEDMKCPATCMLQAPATQEVVEGREGWVGEVGEEKLREGRRRKEVWREGGRGREWEGVRTWL